MDAANDNRLEVKTSLFLPPELVIRAEFYASHCTFSLPQEKLEELQLAALNASFLSIYSQEPITASYSQGQLVFRRQSSLPFLYEDVRLIAYRLLALRLIPVETIWHIAEEIRKYYPCPYSISEGLEPPLMELSIHSGLHFYFNLPGDAPLQAFAQGKFLRELEQQLAAKARPLQFQPGPYELHITGDEINSVTLAVITGILADYGMLPQKRKSAFTALLLHRHIQSVATRERAILAALLSEEETGMLAEYIYIFEVLEEEGSFSALSHHELSLLQNLHLNRKAVYALPLSIRISLRSLYVCFYQEISAALKS